MKIKDETRSVLRAKLIRTLVQLIGCAVLVLPGRAPAQDLRPDVQDMVRCFAAAYTVGAEIDECGAVAPGAIGVLTQPGKYPEHLDAVMDGMEQLAVSHPELRVRVAAAVYLMAPGNRALTADTPEGVVVRVNRLYDRSPEPAVRSALIRWMPYQAEQQAAIAFLEATARSRRSPADMMWPDELLAIDALAHMGERGREALRRLHRDSLVENELARQRLDHLDDRGFRLDRTGSHGRKR